MKKPFPSCSPSPCWRLLSAWAAGPAGTLSVYFYDETTQRYGELTQTDRVSLTLDGSPLTPDDVPALVQYPAGQNGRTLVPVRLIAERLGLGNLGAGNPSGHPPAGGEHHRTHPGLGHRTGQWTGHGAARWRARRRG